MRNIAKIIILLFVFASGFAFGAQYEKPRESEETRLIPSLTVAEAEPVSLMIDYGNGRLDTYSMELTRDTSVFELLQAAGADQGIEIEYEDYGGDIGVFVKAIAGQGNEMEDNKFWQYWVNHNYAQVGPSSQKLGSGDLVEWKFIQGQFN